MTTLYIYDNEMLGDDGTDFEAALVETIDAHTAAECLALFEDTYNPNYYPASFTGPA